MLHDVAISSVNMKKMMFIKMMISCQGKHFLDTYTGEE
jgi:hypothetical protein